MEMSIRKSGLNLRYIEIYLSTLVFLHHKMTLPNFVSIQIIVEELFCITELRCTSPTLGIWVTKAKTYLQNFSSLGSKVRVVENWTFPIYDVFRYFYRDPSC